MTTQPPDVVTFDPDLVAAHLAAGMKHVSAAVRTAARAINEQAERVAAWMRRAHERLTVIANDPVTVAGLAARYHVRAGLDPAYASEEALRRLVREVYTSQRGDFSLLTPESRRLVVAAVLRGWCASYVEA